VRVGQSLSINTAGVVNMSLLITLDSEPRVIPRENCEVMSSIVLTGDLNNLEAVERGFHSTLNYCLTRLRTI